MKCIYEYRNRESLNNHQTVIVIERNKCNINGIKRIEFMVKQHHFGDHHVLTIIVEKPHNLDNQPEWIRTGQLAARMDHFY